MELLGGMGHVESRFGPFWRLLVSVQDRRTIWAKCTIGSEIVMDATMVLQGNETQVEARFSLFGDSANLDAR
jgi:hypothetical protein